MPVTITPTTLTPSQEVVAKFRTADAATRIEMARVGFELETQSTEGRTYDECHSEPDTDRMWEDAGEEAATVVADLDLFMGYIKDDLISLFDGWSESKVTRFLRDLNLNTLKSVSDAGLLKCRLGSMHDRIKQHRFDNLSYDDYQPSSSIDDYITIPDYMEAVQDSSVSGFEFRTIGALSLEQATSAAERIFTYDHVIDHKCSFHVHLSIPGVKHAWGGKLQAAMTEYLLTNLSRVPKSVRHRWSQTQDYFKPKISRDKYSFVHMHSQGTWEFRCFGNVKNAKDAKRCMELAMEALQYGYKVLNAESELIKDAAGLDDSTFYDLCVQAMQTKKKLITVVSEHLADARQVA